MGASNRTTTRRFPLFTDDDKPSFLGDWNATMVLIEREFVRLDNIIAEQQLMINTLQNAVKK